MLAKLARLNAPRVAARAAAPRALFSSDSVVDTITLTQKRSDVLRNASDADLEATKKAIANEQKRRQSTLIIGAAGAVGKRLCAALTQAGHKVIATDRTPVLPKDLRDSIGEKGICVGSVDVTDAEGLVKLFEEYADANTSVWNLAAPLSVDTALNPAIAEAITIGGMKNVLAAMAKVGARKICFTDSIGSFGASSPRVGASARWLTKNPTQDPGSDYGLQKRGCRELMADFAKKHNGDPRFAVLPGVLHSNSVWGNGTTEYALDALLSAPHQATTLGLPTGESYTCPVDPDVRMPMVFVDDLMRGLVALQEAEPDVLAEPENGYCIPGLSFSANELFSEIRKHYPGFGFRVELDANMDKFAKLWPDELATEEPLRDLGYKPEVGLEEMVATVLKSHQDRNEITAKDFMAIDHDGDGVVTRDDIEQHISKFLVEGRHSDNATDDEDVKRAVDDFMLGEMHDTDGRISWEKFSEWTRHHDFGDFVRKSLHR